MADITAGAKVEKSSGTGFGRLGRLIKIAKGEKTGIRLTVAPWNSNLMTGSKPTRKAS
jgi:hypothetical protein